ncbi:MAG TPA: hypothetical protein VM884_09020 [Flavisolibacter sp.]|jgi:hypothetical protein|nr:hypothetical protein [Flavisolibacter sp.]
MGKVSCLLSLIILLNSGKVAAQLHLPSSTHSGAGSISLKVLPQNFYNKSLSFVCKKEVQLQKLVSLPVYIRIGAKDYVDYLEKKPNAIGSRQ